MGNSAGAFAVDVEPLRRTVGYLDTLGQLMTATRPVLDGSRASAAAGGLASPAMSGFSRRLQAALAEIAADVAQDRERLVINVRAYAATEERLSTGFTCARPRATAPMPRASAGTVVEWR